MTEPLKLAAYAPNPIDPGTRIGHVHLRTADIDRVRGFYVDVLGFDVILEARDVPGWGTTGDMLLCRRAATTTTSALTRGSRPAPHASAA
jgi:catechol 2,3-dioxygenase-like lactoylglutathione lyase family enzyme